MVYLQSGAEFALGTGAWLTVLLPAAIGLGLCCRWQAQRHRRRQARRRDRERCRHAAHDELVQGVQGLMLRLQAITEDIPAQDPTRRKLEQLLDRADAMLRADYEAPGVPTAQAGELAESLARLGQDLSALRSTCFHLTVLGPPIGLREPVRRAVALIVREALFNAFQHAQASQVGVRLCFGPRALRIEVEDNGCGMVVQTGAALRGAGRQGLLSMADQARSLEARLELWSRRGAGTELRLALSAARAYTEDGGPGRWQRRVCRWL